MKQVKTFFCLLILIGVLSSCKKTKTINKDQIPSEFAVAKSFLGNGSLSSTPYDNYVAISVSQLANALDRNNSYLISADAKFTDNNGNVVNTGTVIVNNRSLPIKPDNYYEYIYQDSTLSEGKSLIGNTDIGTYATGAGGGVAQAGILRPRRVMVVPKEIFPSTMNLPASFVNRSSPYQLNWAPDPTNQFQKVNIEVSYMKGISQYNSANMPNSIQHLFYQVADNGSFVIPAADLAIFPQGSYITISISRAWLDASTYSDLALVSVVEAHTIPLLVTDSGPLVVDITTSAGNSPYSITCNAAISGGVPPFNYEWRYQLANGTWSNVLSNSSSLLYDWGCITATQTHENFKLTVTDNVGTIQSAEKIVYHRCQR